MNPGYKTTEFYVTAGVALLGSVLGVLATAGVLTHDQADSWNAVALALVAALGYGGATYAARSYAADRRKLKEHQLAAPQPTELPQNFDPEQLAQMYAAASGYTGYDYAQNGVPPDAYGQFPEQNPHMHYPQPQG